MSRATSPLHPATLLFAIVVSCVVLGAGPADRHARAQAAGESAPSADSTSDGAAEEASPQLVYDADFSARIVPTERLAHASIRLRSDTLLPRWLDFRIDPQRHSGFRGDGEIEVSGDRVRWTPPPDGGRLRYEFRIDHLKTPSAYDARCADDWALFRGGDLFPPARVRAEEGLRSRSWLKLKVPEGWSIAVPYERVANATYAVQHPRRFDRPTGWLLVGRLGILRERIAGSRVSIAAPVGHGQRRQDLLGLLRWTLPALRDAIGDLPDRISIVGASDPMWRGGLSAPKSVFLHPDRPLISPDWSSPLLHELVHVGMGARAGTGGDWAVEGLAELYSLEALVRSKTITRRRYDKALAKLAKKGAGIRRLEVAKADAAVAARAVGVLHELDALIQEASDGENSLDNVLEALSQQRRPVTTDHVRTAAEAASGRGLGGFFAARVGSGSTRSKARRAKPKAVPVAREEGGDR